MTKPAGKNKVRKPTYRFASELKTTFNPKDFQLPVDQFSKPPVAGDPPGYGRAHCAVPSVRARGHAWE